MTGVVSIISVLLTGGLISGGREPRASLAAWSPLPPRLPLCRWPPLVLALEALGVRRCTPRGASAAGSRLHDVRVLASLKFP